MICNHTLYTFQVKSSQKQQVAWMLIKLRLVYHFLTLSGCCWSQPERGSLSWQVRSDQETQTVAALSGCEPELTLVFQLHRLLDIWEIAFWEIHLPGESVCVCLRLLHGEWNRAKTKETEEVLLLTVTINPSSQLLECDLVIRFCHQPYSVKLALPAPSRTTTVPFPSTCVFIAEV